MLRKTTKRENMALNTLTTTRIRSLVMCGNALTLNLAVPALSKLVKQATLVI